MIKRKVIFFMSLFIFILACGINSTNIGTSIDSIVAVNQLSDDVVLNGLARASARGYGIVDTIVYTLITISACGIIFSFIKKNKEN